MPEPVWLQKLGTNNSWQKRYFRLDGRTLSYAKSTRVPWISLKTI